MGVTRLGVPSFGGDRVPGRQPELLQRPVGVDLGRGRPGAARDLLDQVPADRILADLRLPLRGLPPGSGTIIALHALGSPHETGIVHRSGGTTLSYGDRLTMRIQTTFLPRHLSRR